MDAGYDVSQDAIDNPDAADAATVAQEFIFDVQTHTRVPAPPWTAATCNATDTPNMCPTDYLSGIFVDSDTQVACLSGYPAARANDQPSIQARAQIKEIVDRINGSPRLVIHANVRPDEGQVELDAMTQDVGELPDRRVEDLSAGDGRTWPGQRTATGGRSSSARASSASAWSPPTAASAATTARGPASTRRATWAGGRRQPGREVPRLSLGLAERRGRGPPVQHGRRRAAGLDRLIKTACSTTASVRTATSTPSSAPPGST